MSTWINGIEQLQKVHFNRDNIPKELQERNQWVVWGGIFNDNGSPDKVPINPKTNKNASSTNPETWGTLTQALNSKTAHKRFGVGFVFTKNDPYIGIDLDNCIDENGKIGKTAIDIINTFKSYTEITPSNKGIHIIIKGRMPDNARNRKNNIEIYDSSRYFTFTSNILDELNIIRQIDDLTLNAFFNLYLPGEPVLTQAEVIIKDAKFTDLELIEKIRSSSESQKFESLWNGDISGYSSNSEADLALCTILSFWTQRNSEKIDKLFRMSGLYREKWDRQDYKKRTINTAISNLEVYDPEYYKGKDKSELIKTIDIEDWFEKKDIQFPYHVISGLAKEFTDLYKKSFESPQEFFYFSFLTALGSLVSDEVFLKTALNTSPRLFTILIGESGYTRKTTAINMTVDIFKDYMRTLNEYGNNFSVIWGVGSEVGLAQKLDDNKKMLLCYDELKHFVQKSKITNSNLLDTVGTLFEKHTVTSNTKTHDINIDNAHLSMLAACTTSTYETIFTNDFSNIGFINRLFIVPSPPDNGERISLPPPIPEDKKAEIIAKIHSINKLPPEYIMPIDDNAFKLFHEWYINLPRSEFVTRLDTYAHRLNILLALNDYKIKVDLMTMEKVIEICNWQLDVRKKFAPLDADNINAQFEQRIRNLLKDDPKLYSTIKDNLKRQLKRHGVRFLTESLKRLETAGVIEKIRTKNGSVAYELLEINE